MENKYQQSCPMEKDTKLMEKTPWQNALDYIYSEDIDSFKFLLRDNISIISTPDGPWFLIHHLFSNNWELGIELYANLGGNFEYETLDYCVSLNKAPLFIIGGQTILHIVAKSLKSKELLERAISIYPQLNKPDWNGNTPGDLLEQPNDLSQFRSQYQKVQKRLYIDLTNVEPSLVEMKEALNDAIQLFSVNVEYCTLLMEQIDNIEDQIPNSMHRYGKVLLPHMQEVLFSLVKPLLPEEKLCRIKHLHAFYIKYSGAKQRSLGSHVDDSSFTINLCLSSSSKGGDLIFDDLGITYPHKAGQGLIHQGSLKHHVTDLVDGERENIIIWVTVDHR